MQKTNIRPESDKIDETAGETECTVIPCSIEEVESHLRAFIAVFVKPQAQMRWLEFLVHKRSEWDTMPRSPRGIKILRKAEDVLRMFAVEEKFCVSIPNAQRTIGYYDVMYGKNPGVFFSTVASPCKLTAMQADAWFSSNDESALLSFQAGRKVLFFCHGSGVWKCDKL